MPVHDSAVVDGVVTAGGRGASAPTSTQKATHGRGREPRLAPWVFVSPSLILFTVFAFAPIAVAVVLSFQNVQVFGGGTWVGVDNYSNMLGN